MDPAALPEELPPSADFAGVPIGTTVPAEPPPAEAYAQAVPPGQPSQGMPTIPGMPPVDMARLSAQLAENQRAKIAANERTARELERNLAQDSARVAEAYKQTGIGPGDMRPWDANAAREQFRYDPIEAFGSLGSVFAIVASAFTNAPMTNAMSGAAAAMTAIKDGKKEDFDRSYKAWQDNFKLAMDRHKIQQDQYQNSIALMKTNMAAGTQRMEVNAARFGDQQALFLIENGMNKELLDLVEKRQNIALKLNETLPKLALENEKMADLMARTDGMERGTPEYARALQGWQQDWQGRRYDEDAEFSRNWWAANADKYRDDPSGASKAFATEFGDFKRGISTGGGASNQEIIRRAREKMKLAEERGETLTYTDAYNQSAREVKDASATQTIDRSLLPAIDARTKELEAEGIPAAQARTQATREVRASSAAPSGNRIDDLTAMRDRVTLAESTIDKMDELLLKHDYITGIGGRLTRPVEVVGNFFGSNATDRTQFLREALKLKELLPRIITGSNARPLAAEAANIDRIVAGLAAGDTKANTIRAYMELRPVLVRIKEQLATRQQGLPAAGGGTPASTPSRSTTPAGGAAPWANDPVAQ